MIQKLKEKEKAIKLRREGYSYNEILKKVLVAKSTLSLWLRNVGLAKIVKQRLTAKKVKGQQRGAEARRRQRVLLTHKIKEQARKEVGKINNRDLWMLGVALYWAEGAKEKEWNTGVGVKFSNSDPAMITLFLKWLKDICMVNTKDITYDLYIHETADWKNARHYWGKILSVPVKKIRVYFKRNKVRTKRRNIKEDYHGLIRIQVKKSTNLNRKITGWVEGIYKYCGVVEW